MRIYDDCEILVKWVEKWMKWAAKPKKKWSGELVTAKELFRMSLGVSPIIVLRLDPLTLRFLAAEQIH